MDPLSFLLASVVIPIGRKLGEKWIDRVVDGLDSSIQAMIRRVFTGESQEEEVASVLSGKPEQAERLANNVATVLTDPAFVAGIDFSLFPGAGTELPYLDAFCTAVAQISREMNQALVLDGAFSGPDYVSIWLWAPEVLRGTDPRPTLKSEDGIKLGGDVLGFHSNLVTMHVKPRSLIEPDVIEALRRRAAHVATQTDLYKLIGRSQDWLAVDEIRGKVVLYEVETLHRDERPYIPDIKVWSTIKDVPWSIDVYPDDSRPHMEIVDGRGIEAMMDSLRRLGHDAARRARSIRDAVANPEDGVDPAEDVVSAHRSGSDGEGP